MMWIVPVKPPFTETLESKVDLTEWSGRTLDFPFFARVLGVRTETVDSNRTRNKQYWESMESGDPLVVYRSDTERYAGFGTIGAKAQTTYFDKAYWDDAGAISVFTVTDYDDSLDLEPEQVNSVLGYEEEFRPCGLSKVSDDRPIDDLLFFLDVNRNRATM
ncbi:hypothetical protein [Halocatena salina]|uniref:EVE domain-containing protein n=1 Tax=Halocatena salina TaxID=2934340 RepID=A0A8T9ZZW8_9EURY|nr:hypothetical protein [Halocatena salina]UPM41678.1 hypothetical protein MW046_06665 [Halocatena salina]